MSKKSIDRKEVLKTLKLRLSEGKTRQEILEELSEQYFDRKSLSIFIASTPDQKTIDKYKILNNILLLLLLLSIAAKTIVGIVLLSSISIFLIPFVFIFSLVNIFFTIEVSKFKGYIYNILGILTLAGILKLLSNFDVYGKGILIDVAIGLVIALLSFYLGRKMFPNYGLFGPKKDANGNMMLE
ncbi:MAG: hypothetical protein HXX16_07485 [Bacteroidales bacterium]|nr:hypothetical protein [Bacteroidales bacterium]